MKMFAAKVEDGKEGKDGKPYVSPIYQNLLSKDQFPPLDPNLSTSSDLSGHLLNGMLEIRCLDGEYLLMGSYDTFATGGCDRFVNVWDGNNKKRLLPDDLNKEQESLERHSQVKRHATVN